MNRVGAILTRGDTWILRGRAVWNVPKKCRYLRSLAPLRQPDPAEDERDRPQSKVNNPDGRFQLFRVGDAVASRNIRAAIYDSLRLCKAF
jgi:hypothetical protein